MAFAHLHVHTEYSLLDGSNKIKEYVKRVKELGMTAAAITDHGAMYGVIDFYRAARAEVSTKEESAASTWASRPTATVVTLRTKIIGFWTKMQLLSSNISLT